MNRGSVDRVSRSRGRLVHGFVGERRRIARVVVTLLISAVYIGVFVLAWGKGGEQAIHRINHRAGIGGLGYYVSAALISALAATLLTTIWAFLDVPVRAHAAQSEADGGRSWVRKQLSRVPRTPTFAHVLTLVLAMFANAAMALATLLLFEGRDKAAVTLGEQLGASGWMMGQTGITATFYLIYALAARALQRRRKVRTPSRVRHFLAGTVPALAVVILAIALDHSESVNAP